MALVDITEITEANTGEGDQDTFELFGRDFFKNITQSYTWEKFFSALTTLITGNRSIQQRLIDAFVHSLSLLRIDDLPEGIRGEFIELEEALTSVEPIGDEGRIHATVRAMDDDTAGEYALKIFGLYDRYRVNLIDDLRR